VQLHAYIISLDYRREYLSQAVPRSREAGRSDEITGFSCTFVDPPLEARYIKGTAANFRELRVSAVTIATFAALVTNLFLTQLPGSDASGGVLAWGVWANAPLNLSLSLFVLGLYSLEPRKSTIRMHTLQQIATGLLIVVTACIVYTACSTLRSEVGAGPARLQRALELNMGGLLFIFASITLCDTITVLQSAVVCHPLPHTADGFATLRIRSARFGW